MKFLKLSGIAAVTVVAAMAFLGASTGAASNTLLCTKNTVSLTPTAGDCAAPTSVHYITVNAAGTMPGKATLLSNILNIECNVLITGTVSASLVTNGPVKIIVAAGGLVHTNCSGFCTITTLEGGTLLVLKTGVELATVTGDGFRFRKNCPLFDCDYNLTGVSGHGLAQGSEGKSHVTYASQKLNLVTDLASPFGSCPSASFLDALFQSLTPLYIRA